MPKPISKEKKRKYDKQRYESTKESRKKQMREYNAQIAQSRVQISNEGNLMIEMLFYYIQQIYAKI